MNDEGRIPFDKFDSLIVEFSACSAGMQRSLREFGQKVARVEQAVRKSGGLLTPASALYAPFPAMVARRAPWAGY